MFAFWCQNKNMHEIPKREKSHEMTTHSEGLPKENAALSKEKSPCKVPFCPTDCAGSVEAAEPFRGLALANLL
jgi:hypothetical protein